MLSPTVIIRDCLREREVFPFESLPIFRERLVRAILAEHEEHIDFDEVVDESGRVGFELEEVRRLVVEEVLRAVKAGELKIPKVFTL